MKKKLTYARSGVDYSAMDPIKVLAQAAAKQTAPNLDMFGAHEVTASRGESAYVWEEWDAYRAIVIEGLGTKNLVADEVRTFTGKTHYDTIAQDTIAMIVNDLVVVGALPQVVNAYFAIGNSDWMKDKQRAQDLIAGWAKACSDIGATWGGGETPTLTGVIDPATIDLGGAAIGVICPKERLVMGDKLTAGDSIVLIESSGIHANGITFVRKLAEQSPGVYATKLPDGRTFGEALLTPTHLYVNLIRDLLETNMPIHYLVNITGHGWRKIMRATQDFCYIIDTVPQPQEEFLFIQRRAEVSDLEMYGNFNMGAGFAVFVPPAAADQVVALASQNNLRALVAGHLEAGPKQVAIKPKQVIFKGDTLGVR